ncbi:hypothetical protein Sjap_012700 [Stephania japonica]|uniref:Uncharacterized protein n=1 Tax=Stephania japonica TaxID=461633 RepID=A0AAP0NXW7_9MAGN
MSDSNDDEFWFRLSSNSNFNLFFNGKRDQRRRRTAPFLESEAMLWMSRTD